MQAHKDHKSLNTVTSKNFNVKLSVFPQSYVIDSALVRKLLEHQEFKHGKLKNSILYRGDSRSPQEIFEKGFYRKIEDNKVRLPKITENYESKECIACTKELVHAVGFAENPGTTQGFFPEKPKGEYAWVYMLYSPEGIDISESKQNYGHTQMGELVKEVVLTHVPPKNIMAAFQIRTTVNTISDYHQFTRYANDYPRSGRIPIVSLEINPSFDPSQMDEKYYSERLADFKSHYQRGYFKNPWAKNDDVVEYKEKNNNNNHFKSKISSDKSFFFRPMTKLKHEGMIERTNIEKYFSKNGKLS